MQEIDAADVLQRYSEVLVARRQILSDTSILPYPKAAIRQVLLEGLRRFRDPESQKVLGNALLSLADFQDMSAEERRAVEVMDSVGNASSLDNEDLMAVAQQIASVGDAHSAVTERSQAERDELYAELTALASHQPPSIG